LGEAEKIKRAGKRIGADRALAIEKKHGSSLDDWGFIQSIV